MQLYLDALGGVAGDMFAAAMLDAWPDLQTELTDALAAAGLGDIVRITIEPHSDGILTGTRFITAPPGAERQDGGHADHPRPPGHPPPPAGAAPHPHRPYAAILDWLEGARLSPAVRERASDIFALLAEAEARVHAVAVADVTFHEVGAWDSIADVVAAAWLIDAVGDARWFAAPLPMGRGRVRSAHGELPVPAPATALLLEGFPLVQDGLEGERITPTGAAILRHLRPSFAPMQQAGTLTGTGTGFGTRRFPGLSNVLRVSRFEARSRTEDPVRESIGLCQFEVDDQSPEDLAQALERLRATEGVKDVLQIPAFGKKGRLTTHVQILVDEAHLAGAVEAALAQTSTLGVRWQTVSRAVLARSLHEVEVDGVPVRVKRVVRPGGEVTAKAEQADVAPGTTFAGRRRLREAAEGAVHSSAAPAPAENPGSPVADSIARFIGGASSGE